MKETLLKTLYFVCAIVAAFDVGAAIALGKYILAEWMAITTFCLMWLFANVNNNN